jgi:hypothetical protein
MKSHTFRLSEDHQLHFFELDNALNKQKDRCLLHYTQGYNERRRRQRRHAPIDMY